MSEALEKQLNNAFAAAWNEAIPATLGCDSTLTLLNQREVAAAEVNAALDETRAFSAAFVAQGSGALPGLLLCLFQKADRDEIEGLFGKPTGELVTSIVKATLDATVTRLGKLPEAAAPPTFGEVEQINLTTLGATSARLAPAVGEKLSVNTFTLTLSEDFKTQLLLLYAPHGSLATLRSNETTAPAAEIAAAARVGEVFSSGQNRSGSPPDEAARNLDRLLEVELEVVVRFGLTHVPLRELVRIGVGSMIELNRQVDEPVELLVNNRPLARGSVVVVDGYYGVCITEIDRLEERRLSLTEA